MLKRTIQWEEHFKIQPYRYTRKQEKKLRITIIVYPVNHCSICLLGYHLINEDVLGDSTSAWEACFQEPKK